MTTQDCTASPAVPKSFSYPFPIKSSKVPQCIAEDTGDYNVTPERDTAINTALEHLELRARHKSIAGQITRLHGIVSLLLPNEQAQDRSGEELRQIAIELEQAATIIEEEVTGMLYCVLESSNADEAPED
jgi:hypothetical protein